VADPEVTKIVEALLFAADAPVPLDKLVDILEGIDRAEVRSALTELAERFDAEGRPYCLTEVAGGWQAYCRPEYSKWVRELHRGRLPTRLSQAALETLAIVAYKQPIVRAEIEAIRGVDSSGVLATLMRRDLITIAGRAPGMGRALMYRTTREFLRYFGLNFVTDLPRLEEFAEVLGLKPGEMELAVEGAESLAGVTDRAQTDEETEEGFPSREEADGAGESQWGGESGGDREPRQREETAEPDQTAGSEQPGGTWGRKRSGAVTPASERHAISDKALLKEINED
jgi:segregation and condensation protein B